MTPAEVRTHSALHVLKGAVVKVLGLLLTASTRVEQEEGTLTLHSLRELTPQEVTRIVEEANGKVREDVGVTTFSMERAEAERHFGKGIYDAFPIPEQAGLLKLVRIPDWETSCCGEKHVESTGEIGAIELKGARFREPEKLLELVFVLAE